MSDMAMPFSVPMTTEVGNSGLFIPPEFRNATTFPLAERRIELPPGKSFVRVTWDGPESIHIRFGRMNGITAIGGFRTILEIPAGAAGVSRSSRVVELASATPMALFGVVTGGASQATVDAGYTAGVEVIPTGGPQAQ